MDKTLIRTHKISSGCDIVLWYHKKIRLLILACYCRYLQLKLNCNKLELSKVFNGSETFGTLQKLKVWIIKKAALY
jgi:hypothetical protein